MKLIVIIGPTSSGKSAMAFDLAKFIKAEIINLDSTQVYKYFDIGCAKPSKFQLKEIKHHLISFLEPDQYFSAWNYRDLANKKIDNLLKQGKNIIIVGGSGLYFRALYGEKWHDNLPSDLSLRKKLSSLENDILHKKLYDIDPKKADKLNKNDRIRIIRALELSYLLKMPVSDYFENNKKSDKKYDFYIIKIFPDRDLLKKKIAKRTDQMIEKGLIEETNSILKLNPNYINSKPMLSIGYKQVIDFLESKMSLNDLKNKINIATSRYAKRQYTWFKKSKHDLLIEDIYDNDLNYIVKSIIYSKIYKI